MTWRLAAVPALGVLACALAMWAWLSLSHGMALVVCIACWLGLSSAVTALAGPPPKHW